jgi:hypothetical protein
MNGRAPGPAVDSAAISYEGLPSLTRVGRWFTVPGGSRLVNVISRGASP